MNKSQGHMYDWVRTVNPLGGQCQHGCIYCYVKTLKRRATAISNKYSGLPTLWKPELKKGLGEGYTVFMCSMNDLFADNVPGEIIQKILEWNCKYPGNEYLYQTKNPARLKDYLDLMPPKSILATTLETDEYQIPVSKAPEPAERAQAFSEIPDNRFKRTVTIEPVMDFDHDIFIEMIKATRPDWVNIGADSKKNGLPEPSREKALHLVAALETFTEIRKKKNLGRLKR